LKEDIPHSTRGTVWERIIGNSLQITRENFDDLLERIDIRKKHIAEGISDPNDRPDNVELTDFIRLIRVDIPRTFPSLGDICSKSSSTFYEELRQILEVFALFKPSVGYSQGMTYIGGMLLLHMDVFESFVAMANVLNNHFFVSLFKLDVQELTKHLKVFDLLFSSHLPALYSHFTVCGILPEQYLLSWLSSVFNQVLPLKITVNLWDRFLTEGEIFLHRVAVALLSILNPLLISAPFEDCVRVLKHHEEIDEKQLFEVIDSIIIPPYIPKILERIEES